GPALALAAVSNRRSLKNRIRTILRKRRPKPMVSRVWSSLAGLATVSTVTLLALAQASTYQAKTTSFDQESMTITGRVVDVNDRPLADAPVVVMTRPWLYISREKLASRAGYEVLNQTRTDHEGRFRLTALLPAEELSPQS